jgi:hypothetical protein
MILHWQIHEEAMYLLDVLNQRIETVKWDNVRAEYVDSKGRGLSKTFEGAKAAVEKNLMERKGK